MVLHFDYHQSDLDRAKKFNWKDTVLCFLLVQRDIYDVTLKF